MFGRGKKTKAALEHELETVKIELEELRAQHRALVAEKVFWQDQAMEYANGISKWQDAHRAILGQMAKEGVSINLRRYAQEIEQAIIDARPEPAKIAAALASAGKDVQGVFSALPEVRPLVRARGISLSPSLVVGDAR